MKAGHLLTLRRADGRTYLDRWGLSTRLLGVYVHRMEAPDPGEDLHDHPWAFVSLVLKGGYTEQRAESRWAALYAALAQQWPGSSLSGVEEHRRRLSVRMLRLDECHRITDLDGPVCWTLVVRGPARRSWGFYLPNGFLAEAEYDRTVRAERRDLWSSNWETSYR